MFKIDNELSEFDFNDDSQEKIMELVVPNSLLDDEQIKNNFDEELEGSDDKRTLVTKTKLLEVGAQYGHQVQWWNPKMKPFINFTKNGIHMINLHKTMAGIQNAFIAIQKLTEANKKILFVGTTKQSRESVKLNAERVGAFYVNNRWLGGLLTNFKTIRNSVDRLKDLQNLQSENFAGYTKKEGVHLTKELEKLELNLGGIKFMRKLPDAIFVSSVKNDIIAIKEAKKLGIPVFGIVDTNVDPGLVEFPIPANDDAIKSVSLILTIIADGIAEAIGKPMVAAYKDGEEVKILGIDENYDKNRPVSPRPFKKWNSNQSGNSRNFSNGKNFKNSDSKPISQTGERTYTPRNNSNGQTGERTYTPRNNSNGQTGERTYTPRNNSNGQTGERTYTPRNNSNGQTGERTYTPRNNSNGQTSERTYTPRNNSNGQTGERTYTPRIENSSKSKDETNKNSTVAE